MGKSDEEFFKNEPDVDLTIGSHGARKLSDIDPFAEQPPISGKQGSTADLREHFREEATQFAAELLNNAEAFAIPGGSEPVIERFVNRLVDHVSNTMLLDPM